MKRPFVTASAALLLLAGCSRTTERPEVQVEHAWLRLPASPGGPAAGYFVAKANGGGEAIVAASVPNARVEMHESMTVNHMSSMRPIDAAPFDGERIVFAPGGKHLMIFGLDAKAGGTLPLTLRFKSAPPVTVQARLVAAGQPAPVDDG
jgi:periplasmic copper chaperone A